MTIHNFEKCIKVILCTMYTVHGTVYIVASLNLCNKYIRFFVSMYKIIINLQYKIIYLVFILLNYINYINI